MDSHPRCVFVRDPIPKEKPPRSKIVAAIFIRRQNLMFFKNN